MNEWPRCNILVKRGEKTWINHIISKWCNWMLYYKASLKFHNTYIVFKYGNVGKSCFLKEHDNYDMFNYY